MAPPQTWQQVASTVQRIRDDSLLKVPNVVQELDKTLPKNATSVPDSFLDADALSITRLDCKELLSKLHTRQITSVAVAHAFLQRAAIAQKLVNCVTELMPETALQLAKELDEYMEKYNKPIGPLHGLPVSIKINICMKGHNFNCGFCSEGNYVAENDATIIRILSKAGAVFHARTTGPQTLMHLETSSNLYGVTVNPYNTDLTAGGSSGGEGALQGLRGSVLGIGGDIGGSIRVPAANNGLYGLRPTSLRFPKAGCSSSMQGNEQVLGTPGPISTSISGIRILMQTVIETEPWLSEPWLVPIPWRERQRDFSPDRPLRVAVMSDDGVVKPHPPVLRALQETTEKLKQNPCIQVTEWKPLNHDYAWDLIWRLYFADGGQAQLDSINATDESMMPLTKWILKEQQTPPRMLDAKQIRGLTTERDEYRAAYHRHWNETASEWDSKDMPVNPIDVILCPAGPGAAPPLNCARHWGYTSQWNLLDYSALVFPLSKVDPAKDQADPSYQPRNDADAYNHSLYDPEKYRDAPISLQLVGRRYNEEKLLDIMEYFESLL